MSFSSTNPQTIWPQRIFPPALLTIFSPREADFSWPPGAPPLTENQREVLRGWTDRENLRLATVRQVHGDKIYRVEEQVPAGEVTADALITDLTETALMIRTADCLPVFLHDTQTGAVGLVHAGWKSSQMRIAAKTVAAMANAFGTRPRDVRAGFGPAIHQCCYEVGPEFEEHFPGALEQRDGKRYLDLIRINTDQLKEAGLLDNTIIDSGLCTGCDTRFFSFRREGPRAGRHLSLICRCIEE